MRTIRYVPWNESTQSWSLTRAHKVADADAMSSIGQSQGVELCEEGKGNLHLEGSPISDSWKVKQHHLEFWLIGIPEHSHRYFAIAG